MASSFASKVASSTSRAKPSAVVDVWRTAKKLVPSGTVNSISVHSVGAAPPTPLSAVKLARLVADVSLETGKNKNAGTKEAPLKNLWKALEKAEHGDTIHVAAGVYPGKMK
ncbi:MAG: DUF1565 domain-containing protein, partial [Muribaculaceae bacterium]|nr:DUF1565 domain-containing protein [Muribaculaceae bacterium]